MKEQMRINVNKLEQGVEVVMEEMVSEMKEGREAQLSFTKESIK